MLRLRTLSALVLVPIVAAFVYLGGWPFLAFVVCLALLGAYEIGRMLRGADLSANWLALLGFALWPLASAYGPAWHLDRWVPVFVLLGSLIWAVLSPRTPQRGLSSWGLSVAGGLYLGWPLSYFVLLRQASTESALAGWEAGVLWLALVFAGTWATDTGAYFVGRWLGRHRLCPRLSPAKTWEGALGGVACAIVVAVIMGPVVGFSPQASVLVGLLLAGAAIVGDLAESWLKRAFGAKDTSGLIPGHGGVLDRLDSLLFTSVLVYYLGPGGPWLL